MVGMVLGVKLSRFFRVMGGVQMMAMRDMGVMRGFLHILFAMVAGGIAMMLRRLLMMMRGLLVMLGDLAGVVHGRSPDFFADSMSAPRGLGNSSCSADAVR